jgi:hypothetical protein
LPLDSNAKLPASVFTNPYKFSVYRNAAYTPAGSAVLLFDTKEFDTGSNVDIVTNKGRFTAPIAGFYYFSAGVTPTGGSIRSLVMLYKNGAEFKRLGDGTSSNGTTAGGGVLVQSAANDFWEIYVNTGSTALSVGAASLNWFTGFLVSAT